MTHNFSDDELLAYARGDLPEVRSARLKAELSINPDLEAEISLLRALKPALALDTSAHPGEFGWHRLKAEIQRDREIQQPAASAPLNLLWKVAAVFLGLAVLGQGAYIASLDNQPNYGTASAIDYDHVIAVSFQPDATVSAISALLGEVGGRIVDGPGSLGLYRVAFDDDEQLQSGRETLETSDLVVLTAGD